MEEENRKLSELKKVKSMRNVIIERISDINTFMPLSENSRIHIIRKK